MNEQEQRIAIAEFDGWRQKNIHDLLHIENAGRFWCKGKKQQKEPPDYLNDLNSMYDAEEQMLKNESHNTVGQKLLWDRYERALRYSCRFMSNTHATAKQRAEALLKTIGKWTE